MQEIIHDMQLNVNKMRESFIKLQVLNEINLKLSEEMKSILNELAGDTE